MLATKAEDFLSSRGLAGRGVFTNEVSANGRQQLVGKFPAVNVPQPHVQVCVVGAEASAGWAASRAITRLNPASTAPRFRRVRRTWVWSDDARTLAAAVSLASGPAPQATNPWLAVRP